ncbi:pectinesterase family protein [Ferdinandcohnia sp. Marseille-Q9671]
MVSHNEGQKIVVSKDGLGDFETVQGAIDSIPVNNTTPVILYIKSGIYKEVVTVPENKPFIKIIGESESNTIITYDNYAGKEKENGEKIGTSGSSSVYFLADDIHVENITIENSFDDTLEVDPAKINGRQAVAAYVSGDRVLFKNVSFLGKQDTLYVHTGTMYFYQCYVAGDVDFIFGAAQAVFEQCHIHSLDRGSTSVNGYVTAASTLLTEPFGLMITDSTFTSDAQANTVYLGRPWPAGGNPNAIGSVLIHNCELGEHIKDEGWTSMSGLNPEEARLYESTNKGPGAIINEKRRQLSEEEVNKWAIQNVLKGWQVSGLV